VKLTILFMLIIFLYGCQKQIWLDDVDCLLTNWTKKTWVLDNTDSTITYFWSEPRKLQLQDGRLGLWSLPEAGQIRETVFAGSDTLVNDYKIIHIDGNNYQRVNMRDTISQIKIFHVK